MFPATGILHYELTNTAPPYKLIVSIDQAISDYYLSTVPLYHRPYPRPQMHKAHISVVRKETPTNFAAWNKHEGAEIAFEYEHNVRWDGAYYWIDCYSMELEDIRSELELYNKPLHPATYHTPMPENTPYSKRFHITIGNIKPA